MNEEDVKHKLPLLIPRPFWQLPYEVSFSSSSEICSVKKKTKTSTPTLTYLDIKIKSKERMGFVQARSKNKMTGGAERVAHINPPASVPR